MTSPGDKSDIEARKRSLSPSKAALLDKLLGGGGLGAAAASPGRRPNGVPIPLSPQQRASWDDSVDLSLPYEGIPPRNQSVCLLMKGALDVAALRWAIEQILARQDCLRMDFPAVGAMPSVRVAERIELSLPVVDLDEGSWEERQVEALALARREENVPFDLCRGPLFRMRLYRLGADSHILLFLVDHILFDGWSFGVFLGELDAFYTARVTGKAARMPPLPLQYSDYAYAEAQRLGPRTVSQSLGFWRALLADMPPQPDLASPGRRRDPQPFRLAHIPVEMADSLSSRAGAFSRSNGFSLFATLLSAFRLVLGRHGGVEDLTIVSAVANRLDPSVQGLIGKFSNTIATRTRLDTSLSFSACVRRELQGLKESLAHQDMPFRTVMSELFPAGDPFAVSFGLHNYPMPAMELAGSQLIPLRMNFGATLRELAVTLVQRGTLIDGFVSYNGELLSEASVRALYDRYGDFLDRALRHPDRAVSSL